MGGVALAALPWVSVHAAEKSSDGWSAARRPNIIFPSGRRSRYGDIGAFGQEEIRRLKSSPLAVAGGISSASAVTHIETDIGQATVSNGALVTSVAGSQMKTFRLQRGPSEQR